MRNCNELDENREESGKETLFEYDIHAEKYKEATIEVKQNILNKL